MSIAIAVGLLFFLMSIAGRKSDETCGIMQNLYPDNDSEDS